jgi:hypothetical protein
MAPMAERAPSEAAMMDGGVPVAGKRLGCFRGCRRLSPHRSPG